MDRIVPETLDLTAEDLAIEELDEVSGGDQCAGTATTVSTPIGCAACIGCASF
ncbi:MAG: thiocillin family RiPP [Pseudonocardiales bacterium]|nr:thiocillin family RiPP [Pseudonocardiales bacterium]